MFGAVVGAFRPSFTPFGGRAWRIPWRLSKTRKANVRKRLREVDSVVDVLAASGVQCKQLEIAQALPRESEMAPRDKYTTFSRTAAHHRKGVHKVPHFTKRPIPRTTPTGF
ncbi:hypothetical protein LPJ63_002439 [Coemansia sp. RSA 2711]|nr:hypothetical protein LPJ70_007682 [Coemansia sp. RSA 2708]KAJ1833814.1 hypothetical protein LPJ63_002439 [Coemansia sp. RSA 2711]KAJ2317753.1 hypothetical protein IWW52_002950 [Coemansia sp. RSA 2704]KAJ2368881.1 hypothetical protein H4S01_001336 [Coemansia sp. RSA 2610]KAJ2391451.1 hypothetical protein H4S02_001317 [Coemansia sp. RSA 2611]KAJ2732606.1 hypothetical protein H4R23_002809 [Coemansia sp. Cherry 401B]